MDQPELPLDDRRPRRRGKIIRMRCPCCSTLLELNRRERESSSAIMVEARPASVQVAPSPRLPPQQPRPQPPPVIPPPPAAAVNQPAPQKTSPAPVRIKPVDDAARQPFLPLEWFLPAVVVLVSAALASAAWSRLAVAVLPLAGLGLAGGFAALLAAYRSERSLIWPSAAAAYGAAVLLVAAFLPGWLGPNYHAYRQPLPDPEIVLVIPKGREPAGNIPTDPNWVDASRFALQRNQVRIEVFSVTHGKVMVRSATGQYRQTQEPYLVIWLRRQRVGDAKEFAAKIRDRREDPDAKLDLKLTDPDGREFPRQDLDLGWNTTGVARTSASFPVSMTDDVAAFAVPAADVETLRLEVSSPQLGLGPLRFNIPKSMIASNSAP